MDTPWHSCPYPDGALGVGTEGERLVRPDGPSDGNGTLVSA